MQSLERKPLIAGNWKMHQGVSATSAFCEQLIAEGLPSAVDVVVCPPFVSLPVAAMLLSGSAIGLGAQNVHSAAKGAYTGEISAPMLSEVGCQWVIVGHSERRTLFGESDETAARRAHAAQEEGLTVLYCLGETLAERDSGETMAVLERQAAAVTGLDPGRLVLAYEPVWAIGTGRTATPDQAQEAHAFLRECMAKTFASSVAATLRILYGGSMKPANAGELIGLPDVDGGLIGGASLDVASFSAIIHAAASCAAGE